MQAKNPMAIMPSPNDLTPEQVAKVEAARMTRQLAAMNRKQRRAQLARWKSEGKVTVNTGKAKDTQ